ncbi:TPA: hypothetical protein ACSTJ2_004076 [Serratia fonticola]
MLYKKTRVSVIFFSLMATMSLASCSLFPDPPMYVPPPNDGSVAKVRLLGNPLTYSISQKKSNGESSGGYVQKHRRFLNIIPDRTKSIGMPKLPQGDYSDTYTEVTVTSGIKTTISHRISNPDGGGCSVSLDFTPNEKGLYEFKYNYSDKSGYCVLYGNEIKYDSINETYIEEKIK